MFFFSFFGNSRVRTPVAILTLLTNKPHCVNDAGFDILQGDIDLYHSLNRGLESIQAAMKLFRKRNTDILID